MKPDIEQLGLLVAIGMGLMIGLVFLLAHAIITAPDADFLYADQVNKHFSLENNLWLRCILGTAMASILSYETRAREMPQDTARVLVSVLVASIIVGGTRYNGESLTLFAFYCLPLLVATLSSRAFVPLALISTPLAMWAFSTGVHRDSQVGPYAWDVIKGMIVTREIAYGLAIGLASSVSALFSMKIGNDARRSAASTSKGTDTIGTPESGVE